MLVGILIVLGGTAAYVWYQKLVFEGVISFDSDSDITTWESSKVSGLMLSPHGLVQIHDDASEERDAHRFHFMVHNSTPYEIASFHVELRLFDAGGNEIFSGTGICGEFADERTQLRGPLLPQGMSESRIEFQIPVSVVKKYEEDGRLEHKILDVDLYQNLGNRDDLTHFMASVARGDTAAVRNSLSKWRGLATERNENGIGAMRIASALNNVEMLSLLTNYGGEIEWGVAGRRDNIHVAAYNGATEAIEYMIARGAEVDLLDGNGETALHIAVSENHEETAKYLVSAGSDITIQNTTGVSPFHLACWMRSIDLVKTLVAAGADIEELSSKQATPLLYAANTGSLEIMKFLLAEGADINVKDETNSDLLAYVVFSDNVEAVRFVLSKNFDLSVKDDNGKTAYDYASERENKEITALVRP